jgi:hypothetical protein
MSLLDQFKQTLGDAAANARDVGQNLGAQAAAQLAIKKLQLETVKKTRDLGARVYEWHQSGTLVATGTVPREVADLCHELDDLNGQLRVEEARLEAARQEAEEAKRRAAELKDARQMPFITVESEPVQPSPVTPPPAVAPPIAPVASQSNATQILDATPNQQTQAP